MSRYYFVFQHNFKKVRNNLEKSHANGKSTRHLQTKSGEILWQHWREAYNYDKSLGIRTFHKLTDAHFELTPTSRMRNHLADEVLCPRMIELMQVGRKIILTTHIKQFVDVSEHGPFSSRLSN